MTAIPSRMTDSTPAVARGLPAIWAGSLVWLSSLLNGLLVASFRVATEMPLGARVDLFVTWAFMSGLPIATTVWCTLAALQVRLSPWRLLALCILILVVDALGQTLLAFLWGHGLVLLIDQGYTHSLLLAASSVVRPVGTVAVSIIVAWGLVRALAPTTSTRAQRRLAASCDALAGCVSLVFGFVVCLVWVDTQLGSIDWVDFFPPGIAALARVTAAAIYAAPIVWAIKSLINPVPAFSWLWAAPYAAMASSFGLFGSSWMIAQSWGSEAQIHHFLLGFALGMLLSFGACYLPLRLIRPSH